MWYNECKTWLSVLSVAQLLLCGGKKYNGENFVQIYVEYLQFPEDFFFPLYCGVLCV